MISYVTTFTEDMYHARRDEVVLDVGASKGIFAKLIRDDMPSRVVCVEASPRHTTALANTIDDLNLRRSACIYEMVPRALVGSYSNMTVDCLGDLSWNPECAYIVPGRPSTRSKDVTQTISFRDLFDACNLSSVDFMKMDIEGSEFDILTRDDCLSLLSSRVKRCIFEMHLHYLRDVMKMTSADAAKTFETVISRLDGEGYDVLVSSGRGYDGRPLSHSPGYLHNTCCIDVYASRKS